MSLTDADRARLRAGDIPSRWTYRDPSEGVQGGIHTVTVTSRRPRHVHLQERWPDGIVTAGSAFLNRVRADLWAQQDHQLEVDWSLSLADISDEPSCACIETPPRSDP